MNHEFMLTNFERIIDTPDAIPHLRQFILDLAVRGKLVRQDPNDESGSEILRRFQFTKAKLVAKKAIRDGGPTSPLDRDDLPFATPMNWAWARIGDTSTVVTKGSTPTSYGHGYLSAGINFIKVESIVDGQLQPENIRSFISEETHNFLARSRLALGDILFSIAGSIGTCATVTEHILPANTNQALAIIRGSDMVFDSDFLLVCLRSSLSDLTVRRARGGAMSNISLEDVKNFIVPVPPAKE
jgi:type I restriction enzyme S subunit